ncbi:MAG: ATP-binding protein [Rickettsiales bacterium]|nr:ATP-binding protein [Rickettsiales bacterium]
MVWRISLITSFIVLIAVFVLLFNYSLEVIRKNNAEKEILEISKNRAIRFYNMMTYEDKENLYKLPCTDNIAKSCFNAQRMKSKLLEAIAGGAIVSADLISDKLYNLVQSKIAENKFKQLINTASKEGQAVFTEHYLYNDSSKKVTIVTLDLFYLSKDNALKGLYIITYSYNDLLAKDVIPLYGILLILFLVSISLIILFIVMNGNSNAKKFDELFEENQRAQHEIDKLKKENIQQSQFLANFTHELRTPLNSIIGFSGLIKEETLGGVGNPEYKKFATDINNSGTHLLSLINDILDFSKAEVGRLKVNVAETDIVKLSKQCMAIVAPRASESGVDLLQSFADNNIILKTDAKRLKQVILNLLSNSVKFTPEGGSVTISVFPDLKTNRLFIEVSDTGVGISEKDLPTVLSLFGQAETNLNRKYEGSGIGLPFAKKLTNLMGGTFEISSKVGLGTRVTLAFPYDKKLNAEYKDGIENIGKVI